MAGYDAARGPGLRALYPQRYILSATTPIGRDDLAELRDDAPAVVRRLFPDYEAAYARLGWRILPGIERVYVNERARQALGWRPRYDFQHVLDCLRDGTEQLQEMERHALVDRTVHAEVPVRVEYSLTNVGRALAPIWKGLETWGLHHQALTNEEVFGEQ